MTLFQFASIPSIPGTFQYKHNMVNIRESQKVKHIRTCALLLVGSTVYRPESYITQHHVYSTYIDLSKEEQQSVQLSPPYSQFTSLHIVLHLYLGPGAVLFANPTPRSQQDLAWYC